MSDFDKTIEILVTGLTCGHCVASVTEELEEIPAVDSVDVALVKDGESKAVITTSGPVDDDAIREAVLEAGYELVSIARNNY